MAEDGAARGLAALVLQARRGSCKLGGRVSEESPAAPEPTRRLDAVAAWFQRLQRGLAARFGGWGTLRALCVVVVPLSLAPWLVDELRKELMSPLFRDAAQCQYSGWCLLHGVKLYRDVGAPDGPLVHFLHAFMQLFVGSSDRGCRIADLAIQLAGSGTMGAALAPRSAETRFGGALSRVAWALLGIALWLAWYLQLGWWQTIQRDGHFALLGYTGLILIYASGDYSARGARLGAFGGGALCMLLPFGRHSGVTFPMAAAIGLWLSDNPRQEHCDGRRKAAVLGGAAALVAIVVGLALFGSLPGVWFWYFRFPFTFHRWLAKQNAFYLFTEHYTDAATIAVIILVGVTAAVAVRMVPRRTLLFAFPPMLMLIAACIEGKGWPNHIQQTTAAVVPIELVLLSEIWGRRPGSDPWSAARAATALLVLILVTYRTSGQITSSEFLTMAIPQTIDGDIVAAKTVGAFLKAHTDPKDRVLLYGHESHVLLNAERRPAVPYYVNMLLNIDLFYQRLPAAPGEGPNDKQMAAIKTLQAYISADACGRLTSAPPGAMVFLDNSQGIFGDGRAEVVKICPPVDGMLKTMYREVKVPGGDGYHVYIKNR